MRRPQKPKDNAVNMVLQESDRKLLKMLYYCRVMTKEQAIAFVYSERHPKNASKRIRQLVDAHYIDQNWKLEEWQKYPQHLVWLRRKGFDEIGRMLRIEPKRQNNLRRRLRKSPIFNHHLEVVWVRIKISKDVEKIPQLNLGRWFTEGFFKSKQWQGRVEYPTVNDMKVERLIQPDGGFLVWLWADAENEQRRVFGFPHEVDRGTEPQMVSQPQRTNIRDKLVAGAYFLKSSAYRDLFRLRTGRYLMITTGWERAENMMRIAAAEGVAWAWLFTTYEALLQPEKHSLLDPIWKQVREEENGRFSSHSASAINPQLLSSQREQNDV